MRRVRAISATTSARSCPPRWAASLATWFVSMVLASGSLLTVCCLCASQDATVKPVTPIVFTQVHAATLRRLRAVDSSSEHEHCAHLWLVVHRRCARRSRSSTRRTRRASTCSRMPTSAWVRCVRSQRSDAVPYFEGSSPMWCCCMQIMTSIAKSVTNVPGGGGCALLCHS